MTGEDFAKSSSKGPLSMKDRYVTEDIPMGVTLTISLAEKAGVKVPTYESMLHLASVVNETDYYTGGRSLQNLGLDDLTLDELDHYLLTGEK